MGRIPEEIWGTAPYCLGRGGGLSRGPGTAKGRSPRVGQLPQARHTFVDGMVDLEVLSFQVFAALSPVVEPGEEHPEVVLRAFADQECIARQAAGLVNQSRGGRPVNIVEHGLVQDVRMRSNASWPLMAMSSFSHKKVN